MKQKSHLATLDGLRGIAAFDVMAFHGTFNTRLHRYFSHGYLAVDFFFVLSGYVIARAYEARLEAGWSKRAFFRARAIRLYPMIAIGMSLGLVGKCVELLVHGGHTAAAGAMPHYASLFAAFGFGLFLIPYPGVYGLSNPLFPLDFALWSLLLEVIANLAYPFSIPRKSWLTPAVLGISAVVLVATTAFYGHADFGFTFVSFWLGLARIGFSFSLGILIFRLSPAPLFARLPNVSGVVLAIVILAAFAPPGFAAGWLYDLLTIFFLFPLVIVLGIRAHLPPPLVPVAMFLGAVSYPLYVLHIPIIDHLRSVISLPMPQLGWALAFSFGAIVALSYVVLRLYDEPVRRFLERRLAPNLARPSRPEVALAHDRQRRDRSAA